MQSSPNSHAPKKLMLQNDLVALAVFEDVMEKVNVVGFLELYNILDDIYVDLTFEVLSTFCRLDKQSWLQCLISFGQGGENVII